MKPVLALCLCVAVNPVLHAQNLVPNGSFEQYDTCPPYFGRAQYAIGWMNLHTHSADYFNACNTNGVVDVPYNQFGFQFAADGQAYVGMATTAPGGGAWYREIVGIELTEPLVVGVPVCLSFQTAMGGFGNWPGNSTIYSSKGLGLEFFVEFPADWHSYLYPNSAALSIDEVPTDTALWYYVSGMYIPDSAYRYIAVGNFFADSLSQITLIDSTGYGIFDVAYAFVDDVRASFDLSYCTSGIQAEGLDPRVVLPYPMPCGSLLNLAFEQAVPGVLHYAFTDGIGRVVLTGGCVPEGTHAALPTADLPTGFFALHLTDGSGPYRAIPVVHVSP